MSRAVDGRTPYGVELVLDLHDCDTTTFNRRSLKNYFIELCDLIDMQRCELHFWDDLYTPEEEKQTSPHTTGTSAVQFILTSSVVIHTLDILEKVFVNIFSCKDFSTSEAEKFTADWFGGTVVNSTVVNRW